MKENSCAKKVTAKKTQETTIATAKNVSFAEERMKESKKARKKERKKLCS